MGCAAAVEGGAAGDEASLLRVVRPPDQAHVLAHAVSVVVRRPECVLCHHPTGGEDDEVYRGNTGLQRWAREDGEDGGVKVVEGHGVHNTESGKVVLVRRVIAVPAHHVKRAVILLAKPQRAAEFVHDDMRLVQLFKRGAGSHKVTGGGEAVGSYGSEVRQLKVAGECFADVTCEARDWCACTAQRAQRHL